MNSLHTTTLQADPVTKKKQGMTPTRKSGCVRVGQGEVLEVFPKLACEFLWRYNLWLLIDLR